jgi:hypothetical protein
LDKLSYGVKVAGDTPATGGIAAVGVLQTATWRFCAQGNPEKEKASAQPLFPCTDIYAYVIREKKVKIQFHRSFSLCSFSYLSFACYFR